jgi:hypothetical protein
MGSPVYSERMDLTPGQVATYDDGSSHMAVILNIEGDMCEALFFTSSPGWADACRRATKEELAMAGFIHSRRTYLAYVTRPSYYFTPTECTYPEHWVESLRREFQTQQQKVRQSSSFR